MRLLLLLAGAALLVFGLIRLIGYGGDWFSSRKTSQELQALHEAAPTEEPTAAPSASAAPPTAAPTASAAADLSPSPIPKLAVAGAYPNNPYLRISSRFTALQRENKDIMGWLSINNLLDEPVVQRDDVFYLTHDAKGKQNANGAIFLEASISIKTRPATYLLYGHNMKTGTMFGSLRNYENLAYYRADPFVSFDTLYEEGRYVIFAVGSINAEGAGWNPVDFHDLKSGDPEARQRAIGALISASLYTCPIDVQPEDQLLLLVTCTENDRDRRVVAARRLREGEDEAELKRLAGGSRRR